MSRNRKSLLAASIAALTVSAFGQHALADDTNATDDGAEQATASVPANMYFTDEQGRPRNPTAEELIATSAALQADIERITGKRGKATEQTHANGAVSLNVAPSKLMFLTVQENEDGTVSYSHAQLDAEGKLSAQPANELPEM